MHQQSNDKKPKHSWDNAVGILAAIGAGIGLLYYASNEAPSLTEMPACNSEQFREAFTRLLESQTNLEIVSLKSQANHISLPHEKMVNKQTGAIVSACAVFAKTNLGRGAFAVTVSQDGPHEPVYLELKEVDYRTLSMLLSAKI